MKTNKQKKVDKLHLQWDAEMFMLKLFGAKAKQLEACNNKYMNLIEKAEREQYPFLFSKILLCSISKKREADYSASLFITVP